RVTSVTYPSTGTPQRNFAYDSATVNGTVMQNTKGRLAQAYTSGTMPFQNGDFETSGALPPVGWTAGSATLSYDTTSTAAGLTSLKIAATTQYGGTISAPLTGIPGKTYTVSGYAKSDGTCSQNT